MPVRPLFFRKDWAAISHRSGRCVYSTTDIVQKKFGALKRVIRVIRQLKVHCSRTLT